MTCKHKLCCAVSAVMLLASLSGCRSDNIIISPDEQTVINISWWGNDARNEYTLAAIDKFQELHPEIKVRCSYSEWSGYESRSRVRMVSDTEADVMQINFAWLSEYSPDGTGYYDIGKLTDIVDLSTFSDDMLNYGKVNGILNAVPIAMNAETVYINKTVYDEYGLPLPTTWDDFFTAAEAMKNDGIYPLSCVAKSAWMYAITYGEQTLGKHFLNDDGKLNFSPSDIETMIGFYAQLVNKKVMPQIEYFDRNNINKGIYAGTVAWVSDAANYCSAAINNGYEMVAVPYTAFDPSKSGEGWYAKPATLYAISKNTEHPEEAALLLDYLLNSKEMALLQGIEKGIPLSSDARSYLEEVDMLSGLQYEASTLMDDNDLIRQLDPLIENNTLLDAFIGCCNDYIFNKSTLSEAAQKLYKTITDIQG